MMSDIKLVFFRGDLVRGENIAIEVAFVAAVGIFHFEEGIEVGELGIFLKFFFLVHILICGIEDIV